jgi:endonuclease/exonuclease/phosphatase family metal-dependent hydrolase
MARRSALLTLGIAVALLFQGGCSVVTYRRNFTHPDRPLYADTLGAVLAPASDSIRVVSYNVHFAEQMGKVLEQLAAPDLAGAEILLLQEVDSEGVRQAAGRFGYRYVYYPAVIHSHHGREFGNAILTRGRILAHRKILLPHHDPNKLQRIATFAEIELRGRAIGVYSVHLGLRIAVSERGDQAAEIVRHIESMERTEPLHGFVVGGDWNTWNSHHLRVVREEMGEVGFAHPSEGLDWTQTVGIGGLALRRQKVDLFFTRGLAVLGCGKARRRLGGSDHEPIWVRLALP